MELGNKIKKIVNLDQLAAGYDERKIIKKAFFNELCKILDPGKPSFTPKKGKPSIVMFVGLQGSGKTTTCKEYAYYHQKRGWKPAMVCVDQLKQNAAKPTIPFYGSYKESDPVTIAVEGVKRFKEENHHLIIIDTSGRHEEEDSLFEEMHQLYDATRPDLVIFVMNSGIGQAAFDQAQAFKHSTVAGAVGAVILTKMDGHAKGSGGALRGVAATKSPVISFGRGEHMDEFETFEVKPFVRRLLGLMEIISRRDLTFRTMYRKYQSLLKRGPGPSREVYSLLEEETIPKVKRYLTMMDSMTNEELDGWNPEWISESRIIRIARDSGHQVSEVKEMLDVHNLRVKMDQYFRDKCGFNAQTV